MKMYRSYFDWRNILQFSSYDNWNYFLTWQFKSSFGESLLVDIQLWFHNLQFVFNHSSALTSHCGFWSNDNWINSLKIVITGIFETFLYCNEMRQVSHFDLVFNVWDFLKQAVSWICISTFWISWISHLQLLQIVADTNWTMSWRRWRRFATMKQRRDSRWWAGIYTWIPG